MSRAANFCVEPTGTSRSGYLQFVRQWRLVPVAQARRWLERAHDNS
jgi:hypothetical protein